MFEQKWAVDLLDMDTAVLHCFDGVGDFKQRSRGRFGVSKKGRGSMSFFMPRPSSFSAPRSTILSASSGNGRCSVLASSQGARI
jgi:hypothetical protein